MNTNSNETFQAHSEAVLDLALCSFQVNRRRVYAWGRSMGDGEALSFAARHRDPRAGLGMFAAVLDHSGSVGAMEQYFAFCKEQSMVCDSQNPCQQWYEELYGTSVDYCTESSPFQRAAIVDIPFGNMTDAEFEGDWTTSMASNLRQTPLEVYKESRDRANPHLDPRPASHATPARASRRGRRRDLRVLGNRDGKSRL